MSKISVIVRIPLKSGTKDQLLAAYSPMFERVNDEVGTEVYILSEDPADDNVVWMFELYRDSEAMGAHNSDVLAALIADVNELVDGEAEINILNPLAGKGL